MTTNKMDDKLMPLLLIAYGASYMAMVILAVWVGWPVAKWAMTINAVAAGAMLLRLTHLSRKGAGE